MCRCRLSTVRRLTSACKQSTLERVTPRPDPNWETARLAARPAAVVDAPIVFEYYARDPDVARYMTWRPHRHLDETVEFLRRCEAVWEDGSAYPWGLWLKEDGAFAGMLEIRVKPPAVDLGYALCRRWWGRGLMTEALQPIVRWAIGRPEIFRVWAVCDAENLASARVLERVGMECEGVLRQWLVHPNISERPRDCRCYSIVRGE
jgi:RimJ/RimL family protein N-acetyltransferase